MNSRILDIAKKDGVEMVDSFRFSNKLLNELVAIRSAIEMQFPEDALFIADDNEYPTGYYGCKGCTGGCSGNCGGGCSGSCRGDCSGRCSGCTGNACLLQ